MGGSGNHGRCSAPVHFTGFAMWMGLGQDALMEELLLSKELAVMSC